MTQDRDNCDIDLFQDLQKRFAEAESFIKLSPDLNERPRSEPLRLTETLA